MQPAYTSLQDFFLQTITDGYVVAALTFVAVLVFIRFITGRDDDIKKY